MGIHFEGLLLSLPPPARPLQVTLNEDPRTRTIRELRAEVAFLRGQLAALQVKGTGGR